MKKLCTCIALLHIPTMYVGTLRWTFLSHFVLSKKQKNSKKFKKQHFQDPSLVRIIFHRISQKKNVFRTYF